MFDDFTRLKAKLSHRCVNIIQTEPLLHNAERDHEGGVEIEMDPCIDKYS